MVDEDMFAIRSQRRSVRRTCEAIGVAQPVAVEAANYYRREIVLQPNSG